MQSLNVSNNDINKSSGGALNDISYVNAAFKQALQNVTSPTPHVEHVDEIINKTAKDVLAKFKPKTDPQGWSGREKWHENLVNGTVDALRKNMR